MRRICVLLITAILLAGMVGCGGGGDVQYDLTISSTTGGTVLTPGEGTSAYDEGAVVNLLAEAEECYHFVNWTGDVGTIADVEIAVTTITMDSDYSITANFGEEAVMFADPNLEAAVRVAIDMPEGLIYPSNLEGLTSLSAFGQNVTDLTGIECCTSLTWLELDANEISDVSPLANLTNLASLELVYNGISDISPLSNLTSLTELQLVENQISDISPLGTLINLTLLTLDANEISDVSPLVNLTSLTLLGLAYNGISDIYPLVQNVGLDAGDFVFLAGNPLSDDSINTYIPELEARGVAVDY